MPTNPWDDPGLNTGTFVKFLNEGDEVTGTVKNVTVKRFTEGDACPQLTIDTAAGTKTVTGSSWDLKRQLMELRPMPGDKVLIRLIKVEPLDGDRTRKLYDVRVKQPEPAAPQVATPPPVAPPPAAEEPDEYSADF